MYIPPIYRNTDLKETREFLLANPFAILVSELNGKPWATHIPLALERDKGGRDILVGHIARANPQWHDFEKQEEVLAIFNGPHAYISSSWYGEEEVPTWDYIAVHIYGKLRILNEAEVIASLERLIDTHEAKSEHPMSIHDFNEHTMRQVRGVVGFEIAIHDIQAAFKLSQSRTADHPEIIRRLEQREDQRSHEIAKHIRSTRDPK